MKRIWRAIRHAMVRLGQVSNSPAVVTPAASELAAPSLHAPLKLTLRPSPRLALLWIGLYSGATVVTLIMTLPWLAKIVIIGLLLWQAYTAIRLAMLWHPPVLQNCILHTNDIVHLADGREGKITVSSYFHTTCVVLTIKLSHSSKTCSLIVFPDALPSTQFRHLRIRLKHVFNTKAGVF